MCSFSLPFCGQISLWLLNPSEKVSTPIKFTLQVLVCDGCHYVKWIDLASISNRFNVHTRNQLNQLLNFLYGNEIISGSRKHVAHRLNCVRLTCLSGQIHLARFFSFHFISFGCFFYITHKSLLLQLRS